MVTGIGEAVATVGAVAKLLESTKKIFGKSSLDSQAGAAVLQAIELTSGLQGSLIEAQRENLRLEARVLELEAEIQSLRRKPDPQHDYEELRVGQGVVLVRHGTSSPYYCPTCAQTKKVFVPLQAHPISHFGSHYCNTCKASFKLR